ncbi:unnamed protein product, partial [Didymodactylos carnosus]
QTLPLFTSLLNIVFSYDPVGYLPYNYLLFTDTREPLVEVAAQVLCVALDSTAFSDGNISSNVEYTTPTVKAVTSSDSQKMSTSINSLSSTPDECSNLFVNYLSRIHRDEDFAFLLKGFCRLLNNPLIQTYLPGSCKKIGFHQELLILFWKFCDRNKVSRVGLMHIGVFILLLLSGERNFGVRLNKPYQTRVPMDIPIFTGTHADLLIIVFHKIIVSAHQRLQPLYDCLLTIIVNISPYLKSLSMVSSNKLLHLLEAFSSSWFLFSAAENHHLVFFLLEVFNNLIQYQFDGNANLVYTVIRKRQIFFSLSNLATDSHSISKLCSKTNNSGSGTNTSSKKDNHSPQQLSMTTINAFSPSRSSFSIDGETKINKEQ